jgi:hypothetical protein
MAPSAATAKRRQQRVAARQQARCRHHDAAIVISALRLHVDWLLGLIWELWNVEQTYAAPAVAVDHVNAFGQINIFGQEAELDFVQVAPAEMLLLPQYVSAAPVNAPAETLLLPEHVSAAPVAQYVHTIAAPDVEIKEINASVQVVEGDFVQAAPTLECGSAQVAGTSYSIEPRPPVEATLLEVSEKWSARGTECGSAQVAGPSYSNEPSPPFEATQIDQVNAFGQASESDFVQAVPAAGGDDSDVCSSEVESDDGMDFITRAREQARKYGSFGCGIKLGATDGATDGATTGATDGATDCQFSSPSECGTDTNERFEFLDFLVTVGLLPHACLTKLVERGFFTIEQLGDITVQDLQEIPYMMPYGPTVLAKKVKLIREKVAVHMSGFTRPNSYWCDRHHSRICDCVVDPGPIARSKANSFWCFIHNRCECSCVVPPPPPPLGDARW